jgi:alkylation response protein AidB-like acyl-CoA dehydrogenase
MDLDDSPAEAAFRAEARAFLEAHLPRDLGDLFAEGQDETAFLRGARAWQATQADHGWAAITWPRQYGGRGCGPIEQIIWNQETARLGLGRSLFVVGTGMAGPTLIAHGSDEQKRRFLPPLRRGDEIWCQLFSEPGAGSDLAAVATRAESDGDDWVVTGQKTWCSGGHYAQWGILLARTDPSLPKHRGLTYFLVDMAAPGVELRPMRQMTGHAHFAEVFLNGVRVPDACRVGPVGAGWSVAMTTLLNERMALGGAERMFDLEELLRLLRSRAGQVDAPLRDDVARLYGDVKSLELLSARIITKLGRGVSPEAEASVMKLAVARILTRAADVALRALGPDALLRAGVWQHHFLEAPAFHIAGGTDEIQKNIAAERVLGLPREARSDRDVPFEKTHQGTGSSGR